MKKVILIILILFFVSNVYGVTISGKIYDFNLNLLNNVIVEVNTKPGQSFIVKNYTYTFNLVPGDYILTAKYYKNGNLESGLVKNISITKEGNYVIDLILFPEFIDEDFEDVNIDDPYFNDFRKQNTGIIILVIVFLLIILFLVWKLKGIYGKKSKVQDKIEKVESKTDLNKIIEILKREDGRINQKDLRKELKLSEAKVSLMITELEHEGKVKKIKKGRGNIIILK